MNTNELISEVALAVVAARETGSDAAIAMRSAARKVRLPLDASIERAVWLRAKNIWDRTQADMAALLAA